MNVRSALVYPPVVGAYVIETVQLAPPPSVPHVLVCANGAGTLTAEIVTDVVRLFVTVNFSAALVVPVAWSGNVKLLGTTFREPVELPLARPVPLSADVCGLFTASSVTLSVAVCEPMLGGENVTMIVQLPFPASDAPQLFVSVKLAFELAIWEILIGLEPLLVSVNGTGVPLVPAVIDAKWLLDGLRVAVLIGGFVPLPLKESSVPEPELT